MVFDTKFYDILGISPTANDVDLKKAYKAKAQQLHPDKNRDDPNATEKFQMLNDAWATLKDPQKREIYDRCGPEGLRPGMNLWEERPQRRPRTENLVHESKVSLEDLYNGKEFKLKVTRDVLCPKCNGSGCAVGKKPTTCCECHGQGQKVQVVRIGPMITQQIGICPTCRGAGESIKDADRCKNCKGSKVVNEEKKWSVVVKRGMEDGDRVTFRGGSDERPGADTGDFIVVIRQQKHTIFTRNHDDLLFRKKINLSEALLGTKFVIPHLDGRKLVVTTFPNEVIAADSVQVIEREGMPNFSNPYSPGKLYIQFEIQFPTTAQITQQLSDALSRALPKPDETAGLDMSDENVEQLSTAKADLMQFESAKRQRDDRRNEAYRNENNDDDEPRGHSCQPM